MKKLNKTALSHIQAKLRGLRAASERCSLDIEEGVGSISSRQQRK